MFRSGGSIPDIAAFLDATGTANGFAGECDRFRSQATGASCALAWPRLRQQFGDGDATQNQQCPGETRGWRAARRKKKYEVRKAKTGSSARIRAVCVAERRCWAHDCTVKATAVASTPVTSRATPAAVTNASQGMFKEPEQGRAHDERAKSQLQHRAARPAACAANVSQGHHVQRETEGAQQRQQVAGVDADRASPSMACGKAW